MNTNALFTGEWKNLTEEMMANRIFSECKIDYENVPIMVEDILLNMGFKLGITTKFKDEDMIAGIAYAEQEFKPMESNKFFVVKRDIDVRERRYLLALGIGYFIIEAEGEIFAKSFKKDVFAEVGKTKTDRLARALLMPQKSLSTLWMSPLIHKQEYNEKINSVAKAFLVPTYVAKERLVETGFVMY